MHFVQLWNKQTLKGESLHSRKRIDRGFHHIFWKSWVFLHVCTVIKKRFFSALRCGSPAETRKIVLEKRPGAPSNTRRLKWICGFWWTRVTENDVFILLLPWQWRVEVKASIWVVLLREIYLFFIANLGLTNESLVWSHKVKVSATDSFTAF